MIQVDQDGDQILSIRVNEEMLRSDDGEVWFLPKALSVDIPLTDLPSEATFEICSRAEDNIIVTDTIPIQIKRIADNKVHVAFTDSGTRKYWDGKVGFKPYMEAKRAIVEERAAELGDIALDGYDDDGAWIHLAYSAQLEADKLQTVIQLAEQIAEEIEGAAEMRLGGELWAPVTADDEKEFTLRTVLPILRKLRFQNVRYNHGKREFGRDILFARITEFQELEHWGAQVKFGDVAGNAGGQVDELLGQIETLSRCRFTIFIRGRNNGSPNLPSLFLAVSRKTRSRRSVRRSRATRSETT